MNNKSQNHFFIRENNIIYPLEMEKYPCLPEALNHNDPFSDKFYVHIGKYALSPELVKEYNGYPLINKRNWNWVLAIHKDVCIGFLTYSFIPKKNITIENVYVHKDFRGKKIMSFLYSEFTEHFKEPSHLELQKIDLIATEMSKPIFEKYGFKIIKPYKKWWKMEKDFSF